MSDVYKQYTCVFAVRPLTLSVVLLQVLGYFFLCEWMVPFALFISLSANDMTLPTTTELCELIGEKEQSTSLVYLPSRFWCVLS